MNLEYLISLWMLKGAFTEAGFRYDFLQYCTKLHSNYLLFVLGFHFSLPPGSTFAEPACWRITWVTVGLHSTPITHLVKESKVLTLFHTGVYFSTLPRLNVSMVHVVELYGFICGRQSSMHNTAWNRNL